METKITTPSDTVIKIESEFDAPRDLVWRAYTDPKLIPEWWGPKGYTTDIDKLDFKQGGAWRFVQKDSEGNEFGFHGEFLEIKKPEIMTWTFEWEGMPGHVSTQTVNFEEMGDKTRVWSLSKYASKEDRDGMIESNMEKGLREGNERMAELLEKMKSGEVD